ncbi:MAG: M56 family metallopeptidase [Clostridia bacterium]|nr:M56 family metallopeptidase [Clostridia bacterium]
MNAIFLKVVELSLAAAGLVVAILVLRLLLRRKAPRWVMCALWVLVAIRLVCPFTIESVLSMQPDIEDIASSITETLPSQNTDVNGNQGSSNTGNNATIIKPGSSSGTTNPDNNSTTVKPGDSTMVNPEVEHEVNPDNSIDWLNVFTMVWVVGMCVMVGYAIGTVLVLRMSLTESTVMAKGIRQNGSMDSPFVLGVFRPTIYLPYSLSREDRDFVIAHERTHIRRGDHLWKPLGFVLLAIHWFNPLLWVAYVILCRDIEAACDEKAISQYSKEERQAYSLALLNCSCKRKRISACPVAFGEVGVKERIKSVMNYKKSSLWIVIIAVLAGVVVAVTFLTSPPKWADKNPTPTPTATASPVPTPTAEPTVTPTPTPANYDVPKLEMSLYVEEDGYVHVSLKNAGNTKGARVFANGNFIVKRLVNGLWVQIDPDYIYVNSWVLESTDFTGFNMPIKLLMPEKFVNGETYQVSIELTTDRDPSKGKKYTVSTEFVYEERKVNYPWVGHYPQDLANLDSYAHEMVVIDGGFITRNKVLIKGEKFFDRLINWVEQGIDFVMRFLNEATIDNKSKYTYYDFAFDGTKYTIRTLVDEENKIIESHEYTYLIRYDGPKETLETEYDYYERYVLTNSADVTWEQIYSGEYTDYFLLCQNLITYPDKLDLKQGITKITLEYKGELISQIEDLNTCNLIYDVFSKAKSHDMESVCSCAWYTVDSDLVITLWYGDGTTVFINPVRNKDVIVIGDNHYAYADKYLTTYYEDACHINKVLLNCFGLSEWPK